MHILTARRFLDKVNRRRNYTEKEKEEMEHNMATLEKDYNELRLSKPLVMDALLETIENLKELKRNVEADKDLFIFDYKHELDGLVHKRDKVYPSQDLDFSGLEQDQPSAEERIGDQTRSSDNDEGDLDSIDDYDSYDEEDEVYK